jgi:hypothetical protein
MAWHVKLHAASGTDRSSSPVTPWGTPEKEEAATSVDHPSIYPLSRLAYLIPSNTVTPTAAETS